jgi:hypothetical protein
MEAGEIGSIEDNKQITLHNINYPSSAASVVFGGHLSARAAIWLVIEVLSVML